MGCKITRVGTEERGFNVYEVGVLDNYNEAHSVAGKGNEDYDDRLYFVQDLGPGGSKREHIGPFRVGYPY